MEVPSPARGVAEAERLARLHADGQLDTAGLCEAIGALGVELPAGTGGAEPVVLALLGRGAMGEVHLARDDRLHRHVAIKRVARNVSDPEVRERFQQEARIVAQLDHPSVPPVYGVEVGPDGIVGYSMKLVRGRTLKEFLQEARTAHERGGRPDEDHALPARLAIFEQVCHAVHYAHSRGVIHRDLKPSNIMIGAFGEVLVMDWGIARLVGRPDAGPAALAIVGPDATTQVGSATGTPAYMSPEQANGAEAALDGRSDQYALGLLLHEVVALDKAIRGPPERALFRASKGERDPLVHAFGERIPRELHAIVRKATALDRRHRYPTVDDMADDVRRFLRDEPIRAEPDGLFQRARRWVGRHRSATLALILALALFAVGVLVLAATGAAVLLETQRWVLARRQEALGAVVSAVSSQARRIDAGFQRYEGLVTGLAFAADHAFRTDPPDGIAVFGRDALAGSGTLLPSPGYDAEVSLAHPVVWTSPGVEPDEVADEVRRLVGLQPELERVVYASDPVELPTREAREARLFAQGAPIVWSYVALESGVMIVWPGSTDYPDDYDPREQAWYAGARGHRGAVWDPASRDPSDTEEVGLLVTAMVGLWDGDRQLGVAALDVSIDHILDDLLAPPGLVAPVDTWLVDAEGRTIATSTNRVDEPPPFPYAEVLAAVAAGRTSGSATLDHPDGARLVTWSHLDALDWTYAVVGSEAELVGW